MVITDDDYDDIAVRFITIAIAVDTGNYYIDDDDDDDDRSNLNY